MEMSKMDILKQVLTPDRVCFLNVRNKADALHAVIDLLATSPAVHDKQALTQAVFKREELMSTGIGLGMAVPHVRIPSVSDLLMAVGVSVEGIVDYESLDDRPVNLVFLMAGPEKQHVEYLRLLSAISTRAKDLNGLLLRCPDAKTFYDVLVAGGITAAGKTEGRG